MFKRTKKCESVKRIVVKHFTLHDIRVTILAQKKKEFQSFNHRFKL
jgi:hypothetical protein